MAREALRSKFNDSRSVIIVCVVDIPRFSVFSSLKTKTCSKRLDKAMPRPVVSSHRSFMSLFFSLRSHLPSLSLSSTVRASYDSGCRALERYLLRFSRLVRASRGSHCTRFTAAHKARNNTRPAPTDSIKQ